MDESEMKYDFDNIKNMKEALLWSIAKWQGIFEGIIGDHGGANCGCCEYSCFEISGEDDSENCSDCKIAKFTGKQDCRETPYHNYSDNTLIFGVKKRNIYMAGSGNNTQSTQNAKKMRDFIIKVYRRYYGEFKLVEFKKTYYKKMIKELQKIDG